MRARVLLIGLIPLAMSALGCGGVTGELVSVVCECEHCDDWKEEELKAALNAQSDIADAYACDVEYELYVECQIDKGECSEDDADWSVQEPGSCDGSTDTGIPCMSNADCVALGGGGTCGSSMTCQTKTCAGSTSPCQKDSDCLGGENKCADEIKELNDCIDDGSEHHGPGDLD